MGVRRRRWCLPGVGDDDVVEGRVALAEARESYLENHGFLVADGKVVCYTYTVWAADALVGRPIFLEELTGKRFAGIAGIWGGAGVIRMAMHRGTFRPSGICEE